MDEDTKIQKIDLNKVDWRGSREFFESLGEALDKLDGKDESYDFTWVGKRKAIIEAGAPISKTLRPNLEESKDWETTENLFIEGDNLDALKLLQESYLGKVNIIYIDPPYNTGGDFIYHDDFKASVEDYDEVTDYKDEYGNIQFKKNEKANGRYHSDWLSMMYPRLKLARNLLSENGVIFISIDDNEQSNLKKLADEIFGEDNFISMLVIETGEVFGTKAAHINKTFVKVKDYVLVYAKERSLLGEVTPLYDESRELFDTHYSTYIDDNLKKKSLVDHIKSLEWINEIFQINSMIVNTNNLSKIIKTDEKIKQYIFSIADKIYADQPFIKKVDESKTSDFEDGQVFRFDDKLLFKTSTGTLRMYVPFSDALRISDDYKPTYTRTTARGDLWKNFHVDMRNIQDEGGIDYKNGKKPVRLLSNFLKWVNQPNAIVLDFFAGSSTSAHAVVQLNAEDGGNRKWIMVQLPEETDEKTEAYKAGYKTIPEISRERIRRAADKIAKENPDAKVDYGFRALTIADTNYKDVYKSAQDTSQQELLDTVDNIKEDRTDLDLLYGVLTASALELNRPLGKQSISGSDVYLYDYFSEGSGLVACFSNSVPEETIKEIANLKPLTAVFKDSSFPDSQAKVNLSEHFRIISPDTKVKVI